MAIEFRMLGPLEVRLDGVRVDLGGKKRRLLLSVLLAHAGERVSTDRLVDAVWGDAPAERARHTLRVHISQLRSLLEPGHQKQDPWTVIETVEDGYRLHEGVFDRDHFEQLVAQGRRLLEERNGPEAADTFQKALDIWRGNAFSELALEPSLQAEAARLEELRLAATEDRIEAELECAHHREVIGELRDLIDAHPFRERLRGLLMLALYRSGRQAEALRAYRSLANTLGEELGIEPGNDVSRLEQRILLQDPTLDLEQMPTAPGTNLPSPATSFVGRAKDIAAIPKMIETSRLITFLGPGGVGKTRLAIEAASGLIDRFSDGVWLVELAPIREPALVGQAIIEVLGIDQQPGRPIEATLADGLRGASALLILDSCEHLIETVAGLVDSLLRACPGVRLWATSTEALGIGGEARLSVSGLPIPTAGQGDAIDDNDAARLFADRAAAVDGAFRLGPGNASVVGQICRRLDGIPLAIELAAARITVLTPEQIAAGLDDRFRLLTTGSRTAESRQQTLEAALDWSYELLEESEKAALRQLSVFRGTFGLAAVEAVVDVTGEHNALDLLDRLAAKSLVVTNPTGTEMRYELLETVRFYARARLTAAGELPESLARHRDWYVALAEEAGPKLRGIDQVAWLQRLETEHDNLRAALERSFDSGDIETPLRIAGSISWFWFLHSHLAEGWDWLDKLIARSADEATILRVRALIAAGQFAWEQSNDDQARLWLGEALRLARDIGSRTHAAWALGYLALLEVMEGRWAEARRLSGEAMELFQATGNLAGAGFSSWIDAGATYLGSREQGAAPESSAMDRIEAMLLPAEQIGDRNFIGHLHWSLAIAAIDSGNHNEAARHLERALGSFSELGNKSCAGHTLDEAARWAATRGAPKRAARLLASTEALRAGLGIPGHVFERRSWERTRREIAEVLPSAEYDEAWTDGSHMDLRQAIDYSLADQVTRHD